MSAEELGGGYTHTTISGLCDHLALDENEALLITKKVIIQSYTTLFILYFDKINNL